MYPYFSNKQVNNIKIKKIEENQSDSFLEDEIQQEDFKKYIIEAIEEAIEEQQEKSIYFEKLYNMVVDEKDKDILRQISLNETKYKKIFIELYKILTGKEPNINEKINIDIDDNLAEEFSNSVEEQLEDIEFYRMLMSLFVDLPIRDMIYEIIVGKQKNAQLLSNLYNKYR